MAKKNQHYVRFSFPQRVEHILLIASFTTLALTGLPQKYPLAGISQAVIAFLGGIETVRIIHRIAATMFVLESIYHFVVAGYKLFVRREEASMVPGIKDGQDAMQSVLYNLGLRKEAPKMPRYTFAEKAEYWAMLWGLLVMAVTGFMLWNPIATTNILPGVFIPAAKVAHGGEAVLAVLAIILWHFWHVHLKMFNKSMFTGKLSRHEMEEEHGMELERLEHGKVRALAPVDIQRKRRAIYFPVAAVLSIVIVAGLLWFITFEETALAYIPQEEQVVAFLPQTPTPVPPTPTPAPTATPAPTSEGNAEVPASEIAWTNDVDAIFKDKCVSCHGAIGGFSAETYAKVIEQIEAGNPDGSGVVAVQKAGTHPGMFTPEELSRVIEWIKAGAPEGMAASAAVEVPAEGSSWDANIAKLFENKCSSCHASMANTYEKAMRRIKPGDPEGSDLLSLQMVGNHPGQFTPEELQVIIDWINAGAPE